MDYFEKDLKTESVIKDENGNIKRIIPSREDSLDRLLNDKSRQFSDDSKSVELVVETNDEIDKLHIALKQFTLGEWITIKMLFYDEISERDMAKILGISQKTVNKRKYHIFKKLKKIIKIKKFFILRLSNPSLNGK